MEGGVNIYKVSGISPLFNDLMNNNCASYLKCLTYNCDTIIDNLQIIMTLSLQLHRIITP